MATRSEPRPPGIRELPDLEFLASRCPRCSLCKFPPLPLVESAERSGICPAIDTYGFHSHSGGGRVVIGLSLLAGRGEVSDEVRDTAFQCTMCGGCDVSCKYNSDIEVSEVISAVRAESFRRAGPLPRHGEMLDSIRRHGHPLGEGASRGDWLSEAPRAPRVGPGRTVLLVGGYGLRPERRPSLWNLLGLLDAAGVEVSVLGESEPDCGTLALQLGDRDLFEDLARRAASALDHPSIEQVVCADAEDFATLRAQLPKVADLRPVVRHAVEVLDEAVRDGRLRPDVTLRRTVAYHDPCHLGRLSEPYVHWEGEVRKVMNQLTVYDPPRPVNRGVGGCYDPPRRLLESIPGVRLVEMQRRREYSYCCGGSAGVPEQFPEMASDAARERLAEAAETGAGVVVTACPGCEGNLGAGCGPDGPEVVSLYDVLAESVAGVTTHRPAGRG